MLNVLNNVDTVAKVCTKAKKFDLVHKTVSPRESVGSGEKGLVTTEHFLGCAKSAILIFEYMDDYISRVRT